MSVVWRKSSRSNSGGNGNCVEVSLTSPTALVRDSKNKLSTIDAPEWAGFLDAVKRGEFD